MDKVVEKVLRLLEQFFQYQRFGKEEGLKKYFLLEELRNRRKFKHYELISKKSHKQLDETRTDNDTFFSKYLLELSHLERLYQERSSQEKKAIQLEETIKSFDKYLLSNHLWLDNTVLNAIELGSDSIERTTKGIVCNAELFLNIASQNVYSDEPLIKMRILLNQLQKNRKEDAFNQAFKFLQKNYKLISHEGNKHFIRFLSNYCTNKILQGHHNYYQHLLNIYMYEIESGINNSDLELSPVRMKNIIIVCVKAKQIEKAYFILDKYLDFVLPKYKDSINSYCKGYLHFHKKDYDEAINNLVRCINLKSLFEIDAQSILYKVYYEISENWAFAIPIQSFIARLSRHKKRHPKTVIQGYVNFFTILRQIYRKKEDPNYKKTTSDILSRMNKMKYLSDKQWLKEKLNELEKKK